MHPYYHWCTVSYYFVLSSMAPALPMRVNGVSLGPAVVAPTSAGRAEDPNSPARRMLFAKTVTSIWKTGHMRWKRLVAPLRLSGMSDNGGGGSVEERTSQPVPQSGHLHRLAERGQQADI